MLRDLGCDLAQGHLFDEYARIDEIPRTFDLDRLLAED